MIIGAYVLFATIVITVPTKVQESSQFHSLGLTSTKTTHAEDYGEQHILMKMLMFMMQ